MTNKMKKENEVAMQQESAPDFEVRKATKWEQFKGRVFSAIYPTYHRVRTINERRQIRKAMDAKREVRLIAPPRLEEATEDIPQTCYRKVEAYLKSGHSLTVLECWRKFRTTELRKIVSRIRKTDGPGAVQDHWEENDGRRYKRYYISHQ